MTLVDVAGHMALYQDHLGPHLCTNVDQVALCPWFLTSFQLDAQLLTAALKITNKGIINTNLWSAAHRYFDPPGWHPRTLWASTNYIYPGLRIATFRSLCLPYYINLHEYLAPTNDPLSGLVVCLATYMPWPSTLKVPGMSATVHRITRALRHHCVKYIVVFTESHAPSRFQARIKTSCGCVVPRPQKCVQCTLSARCPAQTSSLDLVCVWEDTIFFADASQLTRTLPVSIWSSPKLIYPSNPNSPFLHLPTHPPHAWSDWYSHHSRCCLRESEWCYHRGDVLFVASEVA